MILKYLACRSFSKVRLPHSLFFQKVGFIGLGNMGLPMSANLAKNGFTVKAFDLNAQTLAKCNDLGVTPVKSVGEASQEVQSSLPLG